MKDGICTDLLHVHEVVLTDGPLPLNMLEQLVDAWGKSKKADSAAIFSLA